MIKKIVYTILKVITLDEVDFHLWLEQTAILLKERKLDQLDIENLLEEIEEISAREKDSTSYQPKKG